MLQLSLKNKKINLEFVLFAVILLFGVLFRILLLRYRFAIGWDEANYLRLAASFAHGDISKGLHPFWSPMYPIVVAIFSLLFSDYEVAGRSVSILAGVIIFFPIYFFTRELFDKTIALLSVFLLAIFPPLAFAATRAYAEPLFISFSIVGLYLGWLSLQKKSTIFSILTSILLAFSYLTKPEGIGFLIVFLILLGLTGLSELILTRRTKTVKNVIIALFVFFLFAGPYLLYLHSETGRWTISSKGYAVQQLDAEGYSKSTVDFSSLSDDNKYLPMDAIYHEGNFIKMVKEKNRSVRKISISVMMKKYITNFYKVLKYAIPQIFGTLMFIFLSLGLFKTKWQKRTVCLNCYIGVYICFFWFIVIPLFHINDRYLLSGLILCFIWIGKGVYNFYNWFLETLKTVLHQFIIEQININKTRLAKGLVFLFILLFSFLPELGKIVKLNAQSTGFWRDAPELKRAGLWLKNRSPNPPILMSYNKAVDFYAGCFDLRKGATFSKNTFNRVLEYARFKDVEYLVVSERYLPRFPNLDFLFEQDTSPEGLNLVYEDNDSPGIRLRIYKILNVNTKPGK